MNGRGACGGRPILTTDQVRAIRNTYLPGFKPTLNELASQYAVSEVAIWKVVHRRTHRHA